MTLSDLSGLLDALGLPHGVEPDHLYFSFGTTVYRAPSGKEALHLRLALDEGGGVFVLLAPDAFSVAGPHAGAAYRACTILMWSARLVRFQADFQTGGVQALIEVPVEDGSLTARQLRRCLTQMTEFVEYAYPLVRRAADAGTVDVYAGGRRLDPATMLADVLAETPADVVAEALFRADQRR